MKRVARIAWSFFATTLLAFLFFLFFISPARAPHGGKNSLGGRSIASLQEQEFDQRILLYQLCYGVKFVAENATVERRRVCKAMLVHELQRVLETPGNHFKVPMEFRCEDTVFTRAKEAEGISVALQPNKEFQAIEGAVQKNLEQATVGESTDQFARDACSFLTDCKLAMGSKGFSVRKLAACFSTNNITHRKILLNEVGNMVFRAKENRKILYADLLEEAHK